MAPPQPSSEATLALMVVFRTMLRERSA